MCGIAGIIAKDKEVVCAAVERMSTAMFHRGPDDAGQSILPMGDRWLGLSFRRLAILDLTPCGHQPMIHPETGDQIIFNGEIYNFQRLRELLQAQGENVRSTGDTEVLLRGLTRFGPDYVAKLQGMFAFAFYDASAQSLLIARDSIGIKPLYYANLSDTFIFASEVNSILATRLVDREIDPAGLAGLLAYGCVQQPLTMIKGVRSFPSGHHQLIPARGVPAAPKQYWAFPPLRRDRKDEELREELRSTFDTAVKDHLISDVPVGVFLSSGLDSTAVAYYAAKHHPQLRSFTVVFADQPDLSEHVLAGKTAERLGLMHEEIKVSGKDTQLACLNWLASIDQPSVDGLNVYIISQVVRERGITVALSGQGGDELFGGYPSFRDVPRLHSLARKLHPLPPSLRRLAVRIMSAGKSNAYREKLLDMMSGPAELLDLCLQRRRAMSDSQLAALGIDASQFGLLHGYQPAEAIASLDLPDDPVAAISLLESAFYQHNMLLRDGDANSMAHSLEIRVPVLDQRMLDLMYTVPGDQRLLRGSRGKHLLRSAFAEVFTPELLQQAKRGFLLPIRRWMLGPLRELCEESLRDLKSVGGLRPEGIDAVWNAFLLDPESAIWTRAFTLVVAGRYLHSIR